MDWNKLDEKIQRSPRYIFFKKHNRLIVFIQGLIVIGLLIGVVTFMINDHSVKAQIRDNCGYTTDKYECVCDANLVESWKDLQDQKINLNFSLSEDE